MLQDMIVFRLPQANVAEAELYGYSVMYIVKHDETGPFGINIARAKSNWLTQYEFEWGHVRSAHLANQQVLAGGPVDPDVFWTLTPTEEGLTGPGFQNERNTLCCSTDIIRDIDIKECKRVLVGMGSCCWQPGQLEDEIQRGHWQVIPAPNALLYEVPWYDRYYTCVNIFRQMEQKQTA